ncbi:MAG: PLP-dependent aminotransferase family protein [Alphaproteobacteria bacterium]|nr:MAG: PLP-dependent aminotransferase family protein [Alphaproteobacteria bacterium]
MPIPAECFHLPDDDQGTLQSRIKRIVVEGIISGRFRPGERMPSSRALARHLGVSRITVTTAYTDLVADDYLTARGRSGYFVSAEVPVTAPRVERRASGSIVDWERLVGHRSAGQPRIPRPADWHSYPYPFVYGQPDASLFDHASWRLCALQALGQRDFTALTEDRYERDDPLLVEYLVRHVLPLRGIDARPENVLVTMGAQNALWITAQLLLNPRRKAAVENPCYPGLRDILAQTRCRTLAVDVDAEGLPPDALPADVDVVFVTASHHCPTNVTMPLARRRELLSRAARDGFVVVEDDYEFELLFQRTPLPSLKSLDADGTVIYIGSFSKSLFPGLRLGYLVAPEAFVEEARSLRATVLRHPPGLIQRTAAHFLSLGHYHAQIRRLRKAYQRRRRVMLEAIEENGLTIDGAGAEGGTCFWMRAPEGVDTQKLAEELLRHGVVIEPGHSFFSGVEVPSDRYRLAYSSIRSSGISRGIGILGRVLGSSGLVGVG